MNKSIGLPRVLRVLAVALVAAAVLIPVPAGHGPVRTADPTAGPQSAGAAVRSSGVAVDAMTGIMRKAAAAPYTPGTVRVAGGTLPGEYITFARATCDVLAQFACIALETAGSQANVAQLRLPLTDPRAVDVAFVKGNVADQMQQEPGFHDRLVFVRHIAGEAVLLVMTPQTGQAVRNWAGVKEAAVLLSIGILNENSGGTAVFNALQAIPGSPLQVFKEVRQYPGRLELIDAVQSGEVHIGWLVQYPNPDNALFQAIDAAGLVVMGVVEPDFVTLVGSFGVQDVTVANARWIGLGGAAKLQIWTTSHSAWWMRRAQLACRVPSTLRRAFIHPTTTKRGPP